VAEATGSRFRNISGDLEVRDERGARCGALRWEPANVHALREKFDANRSRMLQELQNELVLLNDGARQAGHSGSS